MERIPDQYELEREILIKARDNLLLMPHTDHTALYYHGHAREELVAKTGLSEVELTKKLVASNLQLIASAPINYLTMVAKSFGWAWTPFVTPFESFGNLGRFVFSLLQLGVVALFFVVLAILVALKILYGSLAVAEQRWLGKNNSLLLLCSVSATMILYATGLSSLLEAGNPRYRIPVDPLMLVSVITMIWFVLNRRKEHLVENGLPELSLLLDEAEAASPSSRTVRRRASGRTREPDHSVVEGDSL